MNVATGRVHSRRLDCCCCCCCCVSTPSTYWHIQKKHVLLIRNRDENTNYMRTSNATKSNLVDKSKRYVVRIRTIAMVKILSMIKKKVVHEMNFTASAANFLWPTKFLTIVCGLLKYWLKRLHLSHKSAGFRYWTGSHWAINWTKHSLRIMQETNHKKARFVLA